MPSEGATRLKIRSFVRDSCWARTKRQQLSRKKMSRCMSQEGGPYLRYKTWMRVFHKHRWIDANLRQKFSSSKRWKMVTHLKVAGYSWGQKTTRRLTDQNNQCYHVSRSVYIPAGAEREQGCRQAQARTRWQGNSWGEKVREQRDQTGITCQRSVSIRE